jgi:hypothetical protein
MSMWPESEGRQVVAAEAPPLLDVFALTRVSARRSLWRGLVAGAAYVYGLPFGSALGAGGSHGYPALSKPPSRGHGTFRPGTDG